MILVDTSIWIDHWRAGDERLTRLLGMSQVLVHSFVTGELALGNLLHRESVLTALQDLPQATQATDVEVLRFIAEQGLAGRGIGYIDAHLLAAVFLMPGSRLWTRDKRLLAASTRLGIAHTAAH